MADKVTLAHPSGKFSVTVDAARATVLRGRGYVTGASQPATETEAPPARAYVSRAFVAPPTDSGGGTEVSGRSYARVASSKPPVRRTAKSK